MDFGLALMAVLEVCKASVEVQKPVPETLDFNSYVLPTLWNVMYLWASASDFEWVLWNPDVKAFLNDALGHPRVSDFEVRSLKEQCKELVINHHEFVVWYIQRHYFFYSNMEECSWWAREGSRLYKEKYPGIMDYESKFSEAMILTTSASWEEASKILEDIRDNLESEPWKEKARDGHPAELYCDPELADLVNRMLFKCYEQTQSEGQKLELAKQLRDEHSSLQQSLRERELDRICSTIIGKCRAEVWEHTVNNKYDISCVYSALNSSFSKIYVHSLIIYP